MTKHHNSHDGNRLVETKAPAHFAAKRDMMCTIATIPEWGVYATATRRERCLTLWSAQSLQVLHA
jgi:hypothetical protein